MDNDNLLHHYLHEFHYEFELMHVRLNSQTTSLGRRIALKSTCSYPLAFWLILPQFMTIILLHAFSIMMPAF